MIFVLKIIKNPERIESIYIIFFKEVMYILSIFFIKYLNLFGICDIVNSQVKEENMGVVIIAGIAYLIGSVNFSVLISRKMAGFDVREKGSGNGGTTNMLRSVGKKAAALTLLADILKGVIAILIAYGYGRITKNQHALCIQVAAIGVVIGHTFPIFFEFRGGKGIATSLGILLLLNWEIGLICLLFAIALMAVTKMVSLGSIAAAVLFPILTIFIQEHYLVEGNYLIFGVMMAAFILFNHRTNIKRILNGTENKLSFQKKETKEGEN